jgi:exodeoxyribonuclease-3
MATHPVPSPNFDYKLAWFKRFSSHARALIDEGRDDVIICGDFNVVTTHAGIYSAEAWRFDAVLQPET